MYFARRLRNRNLAKFLDAYSNAYKQNPSTDELFSSNANYPKIQTNIEKSAQNYGQPTSWTHPHLIQSGDLITGITLDEIKSRRQNLLQTIQQMAMNTNPQLKNHIIVIPSSTKKYMSDKIPYVFRQNSDFLYFSGCLEPDSVLVLTIDERETTRSILFVRPKDSHAELWDGPRTGVENSIEFFGVNEAYNIVHLPSILRRNTTRKQFPVTLWYDHQESDLPKISELVKECANYQQIHIESPKICMHKLRVIKSPAEMELMRKTCHIASQCINETMAETRPGDSEHQIFARVDYKCRMKYASYLAYPPVVAAGRNGTIIHYINNTQVVQPGELVLMDAGCEYGGYTSDITRTWPVSGNFSKIQAVLYDLLFLLQKDLIDVLLKEGGRTLDQLFETMCLRMGKYLQEASLVPQCLSTRDLARAAYSFCPHHVSHYLGMDVHDTPLISRSIPLVPGMVCTVEPGIYISANRNDVPKEFRGMGLRIEDDIYIKSSSSVENLTESCVTERSSIESLIKR